MTFALHNSTVARAGRSEARASGLIVGLAAASMFALGLFSPGVFNDGDTFWHLAAGDWILAHGQVPRADPFSYSLAGAPWTAHEWLSEVLMTLAFRAGGWTGVALLIAAAAAIAALVMGLRLARDLSGAALGITLAFGVLLWLPMLLARPHMLTLPLGALWSAGLLAARDRGVRPPLALAALMTAWSNMHGGFVFGLVLIAPFALEATAAADAGQRWRVMRGWALFASAALAAALINPYGVEALVFPFRLMGVAHLARIAEWAPQDFSRLGPMETALIALIGFALVRPAPVPPVRAALIAALVAMALAHARHALLFGLIAPMLLARPIAESLGARPPDALRVVARTALGATLAVSFALAALAAVAPIARPNGPNAPIAALAAVPPALREKPTLNDYAFGGYLIFAHVRPFIDGRADMYGGATLGLYGQLADGDPATLEATLERYRIAWTIFPPEARIVALLDREPGWRRLYADPVAVVHVHDEAQPAISADAVSR